MERWGDEFLTDNTLTRLSAEQLAEINAPIDVTEIDRGIKDLPK